MQKGIGMGEKVELIMRQLHSADSEVRIAAIAKISGSGASVMDLFQRALGDEDWRVRKAAIEVFFQQQQPERFIRELVIFLHHAENVGLRNAAIEILIRLGNSAVEDLRKAVSGRDVEVRKFAIDILGEIGDPCCADQLIGSLADEDINVRFAAVETLGKLRCSAAVEPLLELMDDQDPGLRFIILQSLAQIGEEVPVERLFAYLDDSLLRKALFDCFAKIGNCAVIPHLVAGLCDPLRRVREAALVALYEMHLSERCPLDRALSGADAGQIAEDLERILKSDNFGLKKAALALYSAVGSGRDLRILLRCVGDEHLRKPCLLTFAELGVTSYGCLVNGLDSFSLDEMIALVFVGGELGFSSGLSLAINGARADDQQLRHVSTRALGSLGRADELPILMRLLEDEISEIKDAAAVALAELGQRYQDDVLTSVVPLLGDHDTEMRMRIVRVLGQLAGEQVDEYLLKAFKDASSRVRCEAIRALQGRGNEVLGGVTLALTDELAEVRRLAVVALGRYPQEKVLSSLQLAAADSDIWVRAAVMRVLGDYTGTTVAQLLRQGMADPIGVVVVAALESAVKACPDGYRAALENALDHPDEEVVKSAISQLNRLFSDGEFGLRLAKLLHHRHWDVRIHAARVLGQGGFSDALKWLTERLGVEEETLVRQAIEAALSCHIQQKHQGR